MKVENLLLALSCAFNFTTKSLIMKDIYVKYAAYNVWANRRIADLFLAAGDAAGEQPIVSSFPSVKQTILHIWGAEWVWLQRLQGVSPTHFPTFDFEGTTAEALDQWLKTSEAFLSYVENTTTDFLHKALEFKNLAGLEYRQQAYEMIHHCMNHSTYHRGQLVMMARQLGIEKVPSTDMIFFLRDA
jgi:uncharacterized damage-inducible protein DinB